ncbi:hypothetical protein SAMN05444392_104184 [Seinonella peptonophila]|uniref:DUF1579 domain-containing protein n=1 Tax=Seinonella peptonophila TaxID=112248 RepID=A0A1M4X8W1_9BACL|nr:hypothetical protein [Seinonella peptonophila]SHE89592.1 hypothetical protein SAMN05444392_104184 [Seinonella peptonophila]
MTSENKNMEHEMPKPNPDLKTLSPLIGTWKVSGETHGEITYEWMEGGFFIIQKIELESHGQIIKGIEIIGHEQDFQSEPSKEIKSRYFDNSGNTFSYVYERKGDQLTIWFGEKGSPAYCSAKFSEDGNTLSGAWIYPGGGGYTYTASKIDK